MPKAKSATLSFPVTFEVTNTGKRPRSRNGVRIPGVVKGEDTQPTAVTVRDRAEYLRLKGCKDLKLAPAKKQGGSSGGE